MRTVDPARVTARRLGRFQWEARYRLGYAGWVVKYGRTRRTARRKLYRSLRGA